MNPNHNPRADLSIIFGGMSPEHSASVKSFENVYEKLVLENASVDHIYFVDQENRIKKTRFNRDQPASFYRDSACSMNFSEAFSTATDKLFLLNLLHGRFGEDGCIQGLAQLYGIEISSAGVLPAALTMSKCHMNSFVKSTDCRLSVPDTIVVTDETSDTWLKFLPRKREWDEVVIKPNSLGASLMTEKHSRDSTLENGATLVRKILEFDRAALVQPLIKGREYSVGIIQNNHHEIPLPVVEIITEAGFFGHAEKHRQGMANEIVITAECDLHEELKEVSIHLFRELGCVDMCRFDYIVSEDRIYFLEANYIPGLMKNSIFPKMIEAQGISIAELISIFIRNSRSRAKKRTTINYDID